MVMRLMFAMAMVLVAGGMTMTLAGAQGAPEVADKRVWDAARFWFDVIQFALVSAVSIYVYFTSRSAVRANEFTAWRTAMEQKVDRTSGSLEDKVELISSRLTQLEERGRHGPTHADLEKLHGRLDGLSNSVNGLTGEFKQVSKTLDLVAKHLMASGGGHE